MKKLICSIIYMLFYAFCFADEKIPQWVIDGDIVTEKRVIIVTKSMSKQEGLLLAMGKLTSTLENKILEKSSDDKNERSTSAVRNYGMIEVVQKTNETYFKKSDEKEIYQADYLKFKVEENIFKMSSYVADVPNKYKHEFQISEDKVVFDDLLVYMKKLGFEVKFEYINGEHYIYIEVKKKKLEDINSSF